MFKQRFVANVMGMAVWYGLLSMVMDLIHMNPMPLVLLAVAAFMAWSGR